MPSRIIRPSYLTSTGFVSSQKSEGSAAFESTLERDYLTLLEFLPEVDEFEVQPESFFWTDSEGASRRYTPDVLVKFRPDSLRKPILVEVKYRSELREKWVELRPKFQAASEFARGHGWEFRIVTESHVRGPFGRNAGLLLPYVRRGLGNPDHWPTLGRTLARHGKLSVQNLLEAILRDEWERAYLIPSLWYLVGTFRIGVDFTRALTMSSEVWAIPGIRNVESALERFNQVVRGRVPLNRGEASL